MIPLTFVDTLQDALKHFHEPLWLGTESPLAWPYFLGKWTATGDVETLQRGKALQELVQRAIDNLCGKSNEESEDLQTLLRTTYLEQPQMSQEKLSEHLAISLPTYKRRRQKALEALGDKLVEIVQPALRLETSPQTQFVLDREQTLNRCLQHLHHGETMGIQGTSGVGKTTLAAELASQWSDLQQNYLRQASKNKSFVFWYTIRPDLNDHVESFAFALALFAHQHGISALWQELVVSKGKVISDSKREKLLEMLRHLLNELRPVPLLIIDEVDLLQSDPEHASLLRLFESLHALAPILLLGQRLNIVADHIETLQGISEEGQRQLLRQRQVLLTSKQQSELHQLTAGNPRLLHLFCTSINSGITAGEILHHFANQPTLETLFARMLQRLSEDQLAVLRAISVFPSPVAQEHWQAAGANDPIAQLAHYELLQSDGMGGIEMVPIYRQLIYNNLPTAQRVILHRDAAKLRRQTGTYTAAIYHWIEAGEPVQAVLDWEEHQLQEIAQGQAATALKLFRRLQKESLPKALDEKLRMLCGNLEYLTGQPKLALEDIRSLLDKKTPSAVDANELAGKIHNDLGEIEEAKRRFQRTLQLSEALAELRTVYARKGLAWAHLNDAEIDQAEHEINLAAYELERMRGEIAVNRCQYQSAIINLQNALQLAQETGNQNGIGKVCVQIAGVLMRQGDFSKTFDYLQIAYQAFERIGNLRNMAGCCLARATAYNLAEKPQEALAATQEAEKILSYLMIPEVGLQMPLLLAQAEAYLGINDLEKACQFANQLNQMEDKLNSRDACLVLGEAYSRQQKWQEAEEYLRMTIQLSEEDPQNPDIYLAGFAYRAFAIHHKRQGRLDLAEKPKARAIELFTEIRLPFEVKRTQELYEKAEVLM